MKIKNKFAAKDAKGAKKNFFNPQINADEHRCLKLKKGFICVHLRLSVDN